MNASRSSTGTPGALGPLALLSLLGGLLSGCGAGEEPERDPEGPSAPFGEAAAGLAFENVTEQAGALSRVHTTRHGGWDTLEIYTGGLLFRDLTGDGIPDLLVTRSAGPGSPEHEGTVFLVGRGDGVFDDRTAESGLAYGGPATGVAAADFDGNGLPDVFVGSDGDGDRLFFQVSPGRFEEESARAGVRGNLRRTRSVALLDADRDGLVDLYVTAWDGQGPDGHHGGKQSFRAPNFLYRNLGDGTFADATDAAGVACFGRSTLGAAAADLDGDADTDLYVANDFFDDCLYENLGDGTFREASERAGVGTHAINGMGVAVGDADGDGDLDVLVTDDERPDDSTGNAYYRNSGSLSFGSAAEELGLDGVSSVGQRVAVYWGAGMRDFDNDGTLEIHTAQQETGPDYLYRLEGDRYRPLPVDAFPVHYDTRGSAYADFDRDGRVDIALVPRGASPVLLRNVGAAGQSWVRVRLEGPVGNRDGIGATLRVFACGRTLVRHVEGSTGYLSASEPELTVGLGRCTEPARVCAVFPGGEARCAEGVRPGAEVVLALER